MQTWYNGLKVTQWILLFLVAIELVYLALMHFPEIWKQMLSAAPLLTLIFLQLGYTRKVERE